MAERTRQRRVRHGPLTGQVNAECAWNPSFVRHDKSEVKSPRLHAPAGAVRGPYLAIFKTKRGRCIKSGPADEGIAMSEPVESISPERNNALPVLELDASSIIPMESVLEADSDQGRRPWWVLTLELTLAATILLFFL